MHWVQLKKSKNYHIQLNKVVNYSNPWLIVGRNSTDIISTCIRQKIMGWVIKPGGSSHWDKCGGMARE